MVRKNQEEISKEQNNNKNNKKGIQFLNNNLEIENLLNLNNNWINMKVNKSKNIKRKRRKIKIDKVIRKKRRIKKKKERILMKME